MKDECTSGTCVCCLNVIEKPHNHKASDGRSPVCCACWAGPSAALARSFEYYDWSTSSWCMVYR